MTAYPKVQFAAGFALLCATGCIAVTCIRHIWSEPRFSEVAMTGTFFLVAIAGITAVLCGLSVRAAMKKLDRQSLVHLAVLASFGCIVGIILWMIPQLGIAYLQTFAPQ